MISRLTVLFFWKGHFFPDPAGVSTRAEAAVMFRAMDLNVLA